jgi:alkane 1-monooxygenase
MNAQTPIDMLTQDATKQHSTEKKTTNWVDAKRYLWVLSPAVPVIGIGALLIYRVAPKTDLDSCGDSDD